MYSTDLPTLQRVAALPLAPRAQHKQPGPDPVQLAAAEAAAAEPGMPMRCGGVLRPNEGSTADDSVISLRVLLDGSCLEVFTSTGEALGTRVYRGDDGPAQQPRVVQPFETVEAALGVGSAAAAAAMASAAAAGAVGWEELFSGSAAVPLISTGGLLELVSFGQGAAVLLSGSAYMMSSMWQQQEQESHQAEVVPAFTAAPASVALPVPAATAVTAAAAEVLQGLVVVEAAAVAAAAAVVAPVMLPVNELSLDVGVAAAATGEMLLPLSPSGAGVAAAVQVSSY